MKTAALIAVVTLTPYVPLPTTKARPPPRPVVTQPAPPCVFATEADLNHTAGPPVATEKSPNGVGYLWTYGVGATAVSWWIVDGCVQGVVHR